MAPRYTFEMGKFTVESWLPDPKDLLLARTLKKRRPTWGPFILEHDFLPPLKSSSADRKKTEISK